MEIGQVVGMGILGMVVICIILYISRSNTNRLMQIISVLLDNYRPVNAQNDNKALATSFHALQDARRQNKAVLDAYRETRKQLFRQYTIEKQLETEKEELMDKLSAAQGVVRDTESLKNKMLAAGISQGIMVDKRH